MTHFYFWLAGVGNLSQTNSDMSVLLTHTTRHQPATTLFCCGPPNISSAKFWGYEANAGQFSRCKFQLYLSSKLFSFYAHEGCETREPFTIIASRWWSCSFSLNVSVCFFFVSVWFYFGWDPDAVFQLHSQIFTTYFIFLQMLHISPQTLVCPLWWRSCCIFLCAKQLTVWAFTVIIYFTKHL